MVVTQIYLEFSFWQMMKKACLVPEWDQGLKFVISEARLVSARDTQWDHVSKPTTNFLKLPVVQYDCIPGSVGSSPEAGSYHHVLFTHVNQAEFILSTSSLFFPYFMVNWWKFPCSYLKAYVEMIQQWPPRTLVVFTYFLSHLMAWVSLKVMCLVGPLWSLIVEQIF